MDQYHRNLVMALGASGIAASQYGSIILVSIRGTYPLRLGMGTRPNIAEPCCDHLLRCKRPSGRWDQAETGGGPCPQCVTCEALGIPADASRCYSLALLWFRQRGAMHSWEYSQSPRQNVHVGREAYRVPFSNTLRRGAVHRS